MTDVLFFNSNHIYVFSDFIVMNTSCQILCKFSPDEREHVQKKTFTKWVNSHLVRINAGITDLYTDLRDGKMLIKLLEILSGERLVS